MSLEPIQQIIKTIEQKKHILITTRANPDGDAIASALGFCLLLKKLGKKVDVVIDTEKFGPKQEYSFLPNHQKISPSLNNTNDTTIEFDLGTNNIHGLTYKVKNNKLSIRLFTDNKNLELNSPHIKKEDYPYDLIIVLDTTDLESLGKIYDEHTEFFYHAPIINIDHQADNEHFGELNFVELTAVSTTEIIFTIIELWGKDLLDEHVGTCLLAGIIAESKSFQMPNITPRSLTIASELVTLGAKRELIVEKLFHNKPINTLQIWGRTLANLTTNPKTSTMWSIVRASDFEETQTSENELMGIVEEMFSQTPQVKIACIVYQIENDWKLVAHTHSHTLDLRSIFLPLNPYGTKHFIQTPLHGNNPQDLISELCNLISDRWPHEEHTPKF